MHPGNMRSYSLTLTDQSGVLKSNTYLPLSGYDSIVVCRRHLGVDCTNRVVRYLFARQSGTFKGRVVNVSPMRGRYVGKVLST